MYQIQTCLDIAAVQYEALYQALTAFSNTTEKTHHYVNACLTKLQQLIEPQPLSIQITRGDLQILHDAFQNSIQTTTMDTSMKTVYTQTQKALSQTSHLLESGVQLKFFKKGDEPYGYLLYQFPQPALSS